jgi:thiol-disulfide isomerase/thioredoxin
MKYQTFENTDELDLFMNDHKFIIINVSASWCKPCKAIAKPVEDFVKKIVCNDNFIFLKCDYDFISDYQTFMDEYKVSKIPYFIFIERGVMKNSFVGANTNELFSLINDFVTKNNSFIIKDDF